MLPRAWFIEVNSILVNFENRLILTMHVALIGRCNELEIKICLEHTQVHSSDFETRYERWVNI
jgi:hypothetical protein